MSSDGSVEIVGLYSRLLWLGVSMLVQMFPAFLLVVNRAVEVRNRRKSKSTVGRVFVGKFEPVWIIELKGLGKLESFPYWNLYDENGKRFDVRTDFAKTYMENSDKGVVLVQTLIVKGMEQPPQKLKLALQTIETRYIDLNWQPPIPPSP